MNEEEFNGSITFLFNENGATLELMDRSSRVRFVEIELNKDQLCQILSRLSSVPCNIKTNNLERVGKKMVMDQLVFPVPDYNKETAIQLAKKYCLEGWIPDKSYGSKDSFFCKDGLKYARTTIRRWQ